MLNISKIGGKHLKFLMFLLFSTYQFSCAQQQNKDEIKIGAYYFNGWTGKTNHITTELVSTFNNRKPVWGWYTGSPKIMQREINLAAQAGISFFSFCWYYTNSDSLRYKKHPLNSGVGLFLNSQNCRKLEFNLLVANHEGAEIPASHWNYVTKEWLSFMKKSNYLKVQGKPIITIFSLKSLLKNFGSTKEVKLALERARNLAKHSDLSGITFAICINNYEEIQLAKECGFDILTGYNYHFAGFNESKVIPIDSLLTASTKIWDRFSSANIPYIPAVTLNWDPRPWGTISNKSSTSPRYEGFSENSVFNSVKTVKTWLRKNALKTSEEKIAVIYAWNEYGEGAWLTPDYNNRKLEYLKRALQNN